MFPSSTDTLLAVESTLQLGEIGMRIHCAKEDGLVLKQRSRQRFGS